ncbi:alpha/beta hydrolase [Amphritea pacifica]|uniref:alpha/beta hydrolase n=1 Tax=Amphritea pacifica TaxID=2811233 RepID=UPI001965FA1C|nr:alpha/beta hydrolase [Amphritea pacifica]MBN1005622.1 alpha/beta hydrolase [Amphritea pacifica]
MNWKIRFKAKALRFFIDRIVMRKPAYQIDGVPETAHDEELMIPTPQGETRTLFHWPAKARNTDSPLPALVLIHGGGFVFGLPEHETPFCQRLANNTGCVVINPDYVLSPEYPFPHAIHQCYELVAWVAREATSMGIDPQRIAVGGHSAGGNLATGVAAQALARGFPNICFQILDYPFLDGSVDARNKPLPIPKPVITPELATLFNSCYMPEGTNLRDPLLSPVCAALDDLAGHPPALVITAENDVLREEADRYADMLRRAGVPVRHVVFPGVDHAFTHNGPKPSADAAWQLIEDYVRAAFAKTPSKGSLNSQQPESMTNNSQ